VLLDSIETAPGEKREELKKQAGALLEERDGLGLRSMDWMAAHGLRYNWSELEKLGISAHPDRAGAWNRIFAAQKDAIEALQRLPGGKISSFDNKFGISRDGRYHYFQGPGFSQEVENSDLRWNSLRMVGIRTICDFQQPDLYRIQDINQSHPLQ
jgi:hypothetical protein